MHIYIWVYTNIGFLSRLSFILNIKKVVLILHIIYIWDYTSRKQKSRAMIIVHRICTIRILAIVQFYFCFTVFKL